MKLDYDKRLYIEHSLKQGKKVVDICKDIGISRSSMYAELNRHGMTKETYNAYTAQMGKGVE